MKHIHSIIAKKKLNDKGFSLVELIISIAILVIIMLPLMSNFIRSMQMNKKAERYQIQSNLAASVMEGLKAYTIEEIIQAFNGPKEYFDIISNEIDDITPLNKISENNYEKINIINEQDTYYFAIKGIEAGGSVYDTLIRLDATGYEKEVVDESETRGILNKYRMPELINIDERANGVLFASGATVQDYIREENDSIPIENIDQRVLASFVAQGSSFANISLETSTQYDAYRIALARYRDECRHAAEPTPTPPADLIEPSLSDLGLEIYTLPDEIKMNITKNMRVVISDTISGGSLLQYKLEYICDFADGIWDRLSITHTLDSVEYAATLENVYLIYEPSLFHEAHAANSFTADRIYIDNSASNAISFFIVEKGNALANSVYVEPQGGAITLFTDIDKNYISGVDHAAINEGLVKEYDFDRIYDISIDVCKSEADNSYTEVYYTLSSTKER